MIRKNIKVLTLVLAFVMIFGTTTAFAAEGDIFTKADGTLRYSANQINVSVPARNDVRVNNSLYQIEVSGVKYDLAAASAAYAQDPANWKAILSGTQGLTVVSVSAINAKKVKVTFSQEVNSAGGANQAGLNTNYTITGKTATDTAVTVSSVAVATDKKSAVLTLSAALKGNYAVQVKQLESKDDAAVKTPFYTQDLSFTDTVKPTVTGTTYPSAGKAVIQMSEEIDPANPGTATLVRVDATAIAGETVALDATDSSKFEVNGIKANKEYKVTIIGALDMAGNIISPNPTYVTVNSTIVDSVKPTVQSVKATGIDSLEIKFSEELAVTGTNAWDKYATIKIATVALSAGTQVFDKTTNTLTVTGTTPSGAGIKVVEVSLFNDLAANLGVTFTDNLVEFKAAVPVLKSAVVANDNLSAKLTFDIPVTLGAGNFVFTLVDKDMITTPFTVVVADITGTGTKELTLTPVNPGSTATGFTVGNYTTTLKNANITELTGTKTIAVAFEAKAPVDTDKATPTLGAIGLETVVVTYDKDMGPSAIDVNNYKVEGNSVFKEAKFDTNAKTVELTLNPEAILADGNYELTISTAVKTQAGVAIDAFAKIGAFLENVAPTITKVKIDTTTTLKVTFSEKMDAATLTDNDDFEVYVDGVKATISGVAGTLDVYTITFHTPVISDLSKPVTVKILTTNDVTDVNGTALKTTGTITAVQ